MDLLKGLTAVSEKGVGDGVWLFEGDKQTIENAALHFAKALLKPSKALENHPDFHVSRPQGKARIHPIEFIRELREQVYLAPLESEVRFILFIEAERMPPTSANALLKMLEEPPPQTTFVLTTSSSSEILPTIASRSRKVRFPLYLDRVDEVNALEKKVIDFLESSDKISSLSIQRLVKELEKEVDGLPEEELANAFYEILTATLKFIRLKKEREYSLEKVVKYVDQAKKGYERFVGFSSTLETFFLSVLRLSRKIAE